QTDMNGTAQLTATTNGMPIDSYVTATGMPAYAVTHQYPSRPYDQDQDLVVPLITFNDLSLLAEAGGTVFATSKAQLKITVVDCDGHPMAGAVVSMPSGEIVYEAGGSPSPSANQTDMSGNAYVFNATPGTLTVNARASSGAGLRARDVMAPGTAWTLVAI